LFLKSFPHPLALSLVSRRLSLSYRHFRMGVSPFYDFFSPTFFPSRSRSQSPSPLASVDSLYVLLLLPPPIPPIYDTSCLPSSPFGIRRSRLHSFILSFAHSPFRTNRDPEDQRFPPLLTNILFPRHDLCLSPLPPSSPPLLMYFSPDTRYQIVSPVCHPLCIFLTSSFEPPSIIGSLPS